MNSKPQSETKLKKSENKKLNEAKKVAAEKLITSQVYTHTHTAKVSHRGETCSRMEEVIAL